jgi:hypothetical protein
LSVETVEKQFLFLQSGLHDYFERRLSVIKEFRIRLISDVSSSLSIKMLRSLKIRPETNFEDIDEGITFVVCCGRTGSLGFLNIYSEIFQNAEPDIHFTAGVTSSCRQRRAFSNGTSPPSLHRASATPDRGKGPNRLDAEGKCQTF